MNWKVVRLQGPFVLEVGVSLHYQAFDGTDDLLLADAAWTWSAGRDTVGIVELKEYVGGKLSDECMP